MNEVKASSSSRANSKMANQLANLTTVVTLLLERQSAPKVEACACCGAKDHNSSSCAYVASGGYGEANYWGQYG